jgi:hypothetical protein
MNKREEEALQRVERDPRRQWGWEPSPLASVEEQRAYQAYEMMPKVAAGELPVSALPESYGGRPTGTSRRAIRMAAEYDLAQEKALEQERIRQQIEATQRQEQMFQLDYASKQYDLRTKQNEDLFNLRKDADLKQAEAEFTEFRNKLNPNDPSSVGMLYSYISKDPRLANSKVAYASADFFTKSAENSEVSLANQDREKKASIINKAYAEGLTEKEIEGTKFADPKTGIADFNYAEIERLTAQKTGGRKTKEPEEEEYKPVSVTEARDRRDVVQAEFDTLSASVEKGELEDDDPDYVKTRARLRRAEAELKVAERAKPSEAPAAPASNLPKTGDTRNGFRYTGPSNDKKAASNPSNWARE